MGIPGATAEATVASRLWSSRQLVIFLVAQVATLGTGQPGACSLPQSKGSASGWRWTPMHRTVACPGCPRG
jgi:hypothetical protein